MLMLEQRGSYLYRNGDVVGKLQNPYCIAVRDRRHYFRKFDGFALAVESYEWLLNKGYIYFEVKYQPEKKLIVYRISDFASGYKVDYPPHGEQYVLSLSYAISNHYSSKYERNRNNQHDTFRRPRHFS